MIDIELIRNEPEKVKAGITAKGSKVNLDLVIELDGRYRGKQVEVDALRAERNALSIEESKSRGAELKHRLGVLEKEFNEIGGQLKELLHTIPNLPSDDTPVGPDETSNRVIRSVGDKPNFDFIPKPHWELGEELDLIDSVRAAKISGSRFIYLKGRLALLEFALMQYALSILTDPRKIGEIIESTNLSISASPFVPVIPPVFIKPEVMQKMGRLEPKEERYYIPSDDLYLVGSAEHTLGPLHMDEIFSEKDLPRRYIGFSTAFRREAGTYGRDTRGMLRLHQFNKLEMESFCLPENSLVEQDFFVAIQEYLTQSLGLPYQVVMISTGDMGGPDARQIDIETWMPGQNAYRETHTSDLMTDFQARRLNIRVNLEAGGKEFVHMNDATAFAGRTLAAILENYQQADGSILVPDALVSFCGFSEIK